MMKLVYIGVILYLSVQGYTCMSDCMCLSSDIDDLALKVAEIEDLLNELVERVRNTRETGLNIEKRVNELTDNDMCTTFWEYNCGKRCIPYYLVCDGQSDCSDGEDERPQLCQRFIEGGSTWQGIGLGAGYFGFRDFTMVINDIKVIDFFPGVPEVTLTEPTPISDGWIKYYIGRGMYHYGQGRLYYWFDSLEDVGLDYYVLERAQGNRDHVIEKAYRAGTQYQDVLKTTPMAHFYYTPK